MEFRLLNRVVRDKTVVGYRIIHLVSGGIKSASIEGTSLFLSKQPCMNAELVRGEIVGTEGSLARIPAISVEGQMVGDQRVVVLEILYKGDVPESVKIMDSTGKKAELRYGDALAYIEKVGAVNAKISEGMLSAIKGKLSRVYDRYDITSEAEAKYNLVGVDLRDYMGFNASKKEIGSFRPKGKGNKSSGMSDVVVPRSLGGVPVKKVKGAAFRYKQLKSLRIEDGIEVLGDCAFANNEIKNVVIPKSVKKIGANPFLGNEGIQVVVDPENRYYKVVDGNLYSINGDTLIGMYGDKKIRDGVKTIGSYACFSLGLEEIRLPEGVESIERYAFAENDLTKVFFPNSLKGLLNSAFKDNKLKEIEIPEKVKVIHIGVFSGNKLERVVLPEGLKEIRDKAFKGNKIRELDLPKELEELGEEAFSKCEIESLKINEKLRVIGDRAFIYNHIREVQFTRELVSVGFEAFAYCKLEKVRLLKELSNIGKGAFKGCEITEVELEEGLVNISDKLFKGNRIKHVKIPRSVKVISLEAFKRNELESVEFQDNGVLKLIGYSAFEDNKLTMVNLVSTVQAVGDAAFFNNNIKVVNLDGCNVRIKDGAFSRNAGVEFKGSGKYQVIQAP